MKTGLAALRGMPVAGQGEVHGRCQSSRPLSGAIAHSPLALKKTA